MCDTWRVLTADTYNTFMFDLLYVIYDEWIL